LVTVLGTKEAPTGRGKTIGVRRSLWNGLGDLFRVDFHSHKSYWWLIAERFLVLFGIYGLQQFVQYYIRDVLEVANPVQVTGNLMAALAVGLVLLALAGGWLSDRYGTKRMIAVGSILIGVGSLFLPLARTELTLALIGSLVGGGLGLFLTANWALASKLAPDGEAGKYLGLTNIATAGSAALGRLWGPILDALNNGWPGMWAGYTAMFIFGGMCALASLFVLKKVKDA
jgi:MFS family permease